MKPDTRRRLYAEQVRRQLVERGTPCDPVADDMATVMRQLREWVALLELRRPLGVTMLDRIVFPERKRPA